MASLQANATADTDGTSTGTSHSGPCTVWVSGVFDGATVVIQGADAATASKFAKLDRTVAAQSRFSEPGNVACNAQGTYYLRAEIQNAGASTDLTVVTTL